MTDYKEFAGTEEQELNIAEEAAINGITEWRRKRFQLDYDQRVKKQITYKIFSMKELFKHITEVKYPEMYGKRMDVDEYNIEIITQLCAYFTNDSSFKGSFEKGILLMGNVGQGKSQLMQLFCANQKQSYVMRSCKEITDGYFRLENNEQDTYMKRYHHAIPAGESRYFGQSILGYCFDDLGTDEEKKHYGNAINVMNEIILSRYNRLHELKMMTHMTTNLGGTEIERDYGTRTRSRMKEMFNVLKFSKEAPDRRK